MYNPDFKFVVEPEHFDKYTDRELLQYCLGATMYMPGFKDFTPKILERAMPGLTTMVLCFEDACPEEKVPEAMENVHHLLATVTEAVDSGKLNPDFVPLIFVRIRNLEQFKEFGNKLTKQEVRSLCGVNFPKFNAENGYEYYAYLRDLNNRFGEIIYGMPIIEDPEVVNALMAVTKEEYDDACQILGTGGGVVKGSGGNKMNEIKPHTNWAKKVYNRARAFGVIKNESGFVKLFAVNE